MGHLTRDDVDDTVLPAGSLAGWVDELQRALRGEADAVVPCNGCTACCTSSQFVHVGPEETDALAHIPGELLFAAPRLPQGHRVMGYDTRGHCPMLQGGTCSIYEHRPRACRTYDCRVFAATGVDLVEGDQRAIAQRARRWRFDVTTADDRACHDALRAAARYVREHESSATSTQHALRAVEEHVRFLPRGGRQPLAPGGPIVDAAGPKRST
jgi:Fe-S-cluster containining protein